MCESEAVLGYNISMIVRGIVKEGKIELEQGAKLPEGAPVRVEFTGEEWLKQWTQLAEQISQKWRSPLSAVELLSEMRR